MKLPVDNFQILGASPASSVRNILMILERRLERCNYPGFSERTLKHRTDLLREYSKPLLDSEKRQEFEREYRHGTFENEKKYFLNIPTGFEIGGLLLLLESGQFDECLNLANSLSNIYHSNGSKTSEDIIDFNLLIGYATLEYARELKSKRYYDYCARILEKGLLHLQHKSNLNKVTDQIIKEIEEIIPFRILDLISRNMDREGREHGIQLLNEFVIKRGGLDNESNLYMKDGEFKSFFRQIRYYLTVQEQIDLYKCWCISSSQTGCFLLGIALVASGFARRKPEHLVQALEVMHKLESNEIEDMLGYIYLLLGKIETVIKISQEYKQSNQEWSEESSRVRLGDLCIQCRDWLKTDVLEGYRDLEADPDLEAYFNDRDVTDFIEKNDFNIVSENLGSKSFFERIGINNNLFAQSTIRQATENQNGHLDKGVSLETTERYYDNKTKRRIRPKKLAMGIGLIVICLLVLVSIIRNNKVKTKSLTQIEGRNIPLSKKKKTNGFVSNSPVYLDRSLQDGKEIPDERKIYDILSVWLQIKALGLSGQQIPTNVTLIATPEAIKRLEDERLDDKRRGEMQEISARVNSLRIIRKSMNEIEIDASLDYADKRLNQRKKTIGETPKHQFNKRYILVNRNSKWLIQ